MKGLKINTKIITKIDTKHKLETLDEPMKNHKLECSHIFDNFYISGYNVSLNKELLIKENFTHIINCAAGSQNFKPEIFSEFEYLLLDVKDDPGFDIIYAIYMTIDFIETAVSKNGKILIHCVEVTIY